MSATCKVKVKRKEESTVSVETVPSKKTAVKSTSIGNSLPEKLEPVSEPKPRFVHKKPNVNSPEITNQFLVPYGTSKGIAGPIAILSKEVRIGSQGGIIGNPKAGKRRGGRERKLHIYDEERQLRDKVIAHTPEGKRIFAYNNNGVPICFAKRSKESENYPEGHIGRVRCQSHITMMNGRCARHGGNARSGLMHPHAKHLRTAESLPRHLRVDMLAAENDPDLLSLRHEIKLSDVRIASLKRDLELGLNSTAARRIDNLLQTINEKLSKKSSSQSINELLYELIEVYQKGKSEKAGWKELEEAKEARRKLSESEAKRETQLKLTLGANQVLTLVSAMATIARDLIAKLMKDLESRYIFIDKANAPLALQQTLKEFVDSNPTSTAVVKRLDLSWQTLFLTDMTRKLGKLTTGTVREEEKDAMYSDSESDIMDE